jgi:hypothetical protein
MKTLKCFMMMQFKGSKQNSIFEKVEETINRVNTLNEYSIELIRADLKEPLSISSLEEHLKTHIDNCSFAIAEISQLNPNVMFELGYAIGIGKPVIIMAQKGVKLPADFSGRLFFQYSVDMLDIIPQKFKGFIIGAIDSSIANRQKNKYNVKAFVNRNSSDLIEKLKQSELNIDIITTNLKSFIESGMADIIKIQLEKKTNLKVRILTLDPESDFAAHRARQLKDSTRFFREELRLSLMQTSQMLYYFPKRCKIATFDEFPPQISFRIDDAIYSNMVSSNQQSRYNIILRFHESDAGVMQTFIQHFNTVWGRSKTFHRVQPDSNDKC